MATATKAAPSQRKLFDAGGRDAKHPLKSYQQLGPPKQTSEVSETSEVSKPPEPKLIRPVKRLDDAEPVVTTENDILIAFSELTWIAFKLDTVTKLQNTELDIVRKKYAPHFQVDPKATAAAGEPPPQTLDQRKLALQAAIETYARDHKSELITEQLKTKDFQIGTISFAENPESLMPLPVEVAEDETQPTDAKLLEKVLDNLLTEYELPKAVERALNKKVGETGRKLCDFLRCKWTLDAAGILKLFKAKSLDNPKLAPLGLKVDRREENITVKLKA